MQKNDKDFIANIIQELIKQKRCETGKSATLFCYENEISTSSLNDIEKGLTKNIKLYTLLDICCALGITPADMFLEIEKRYGKEIFLKNYN